jgi:hypothetical protein
MKPLDIYLEFGVDQFNVRSREAEDILTRFAIRKILRERKLTLKEIGRIEGSIDGGEPVHHSSIIKSLKSEDSRILGEVLLIKEQLSKWERAEQEAKSVDIKKALRESGAIPASTETATERAIRERRQHKEALDRLKMRIDEKQSEAQRVIQNLSEDRASKEFLSEFDRRAEEGAKPFAERRVVQKPKSLLTRIVEFFTGD